MLPLPGSRGVIPGQGTKIPHVIQHGQKISLKKVHRTVPAGTLRRTVLFVSGQKLEVSQPRGPPGAGACKGRRQESWVG